MNKTITIEQHNTNPTRFGGIINFSDYTTEENRTINPDSESHIVRRIISDKKFDEECRRNLLARNRQKGYRKK